MLRFWIVSSDKRKIFLPRAIRTYFIVTTIEFQVHKFCNIELNDRVENCSSLVLNNGTTGNTKRFKYGRPNIRSDEKLIEDPV